MTSDHAPWKDFMKKYIPLDGNDFFAININHRDANKLLGNIKNSFIRDTLLYWTNYTHTDKDDIDIAHQLLWYNSFIRIKKDIIFYKSWYDRGVKFVKDLYVNHVLLSLVDFQVKYNIQTNFLTYNGLIHSLPRHWKIFMETNYNDEERVISKIDQIQSAPKVCKFVYKELTEKIAKIPEKPLV